MKRPNDIADGSDQSTCTIMIDGKKYVAAKGEMLLSVLFAYEKRAISKNDHGQITGAFCGMGICYLCTVRVNGVFKRRSCMTPVEDGMVVETQSNLFHRPNFDDQENE